MPIKVNFASHLDVILEKTAHAMDKSGDDLSQYLVEIVQEEILYGYSKPIVDTGALFDSIKAEVQMASQNTYTVNAGSNLHYAKYVHNGTSKMKARPFIRSAFNKNQAKIKEIMTDPFRNA